MGLLELLRGGSSSTGSQPASVPQKQIEPQKAAPAPAAAAVNDRIKVKFSGKVPYYDPEFKSIEIAFSGFGEVKSESWAKAPNGSEFVGRIIEMSVTKGIMKAGDEKLSYKDLPKKTTDIRKAAVEALKEKNIEVVTLAINSIVPTPESRAAMDKTKSLNQ